MAYAGLILDNPVSGERFEFRRTAADTNGELLEFDLIMAHDDLDYIPSIVPTRDGVPQRSSNTARPSKGERNRNPNPAKQSPNEGGTGVLARVFITLSLIAAGMACAWAWQLQTQLGQANEQIANYAARIGDLEARLSDTDEGMNQNAEVQAKKGCPARGRGAQALGQVWKETKIDWASWSLPAQLREKASRAWKALLATTQSQLKVASTDIGELKSVAGDLARLMDSAKASQAEDRTSSGQPQPN